MKAFLKEISPLALAFSMMLVSFPFLFRADNSFITLFEAHNTTVLFLVFLLCSSLLAAGFVTIRTSLRHPSTIVVISGGLLLAVGELSAIALSSTPLHAVAQSCLAGFLVGLGFILLLHQWCLFLISLSQWGVILNISVVLLATSLISSVLRFLDSPALLCLALALLALVNSLLLALYYRKRHISLKSVALVGKDSAHQKNSSQKRGRQAGKSKTSGTSLNTVKELFLYVWSGCFGIFFIFFTMGLTFWPETAGLSPGGINFVKPAAYCIVFFPLILLWIKAKADAPPQPVLEFYYRAVLPIGAAIVLISPFLHNFLPDSFMVLVPLFSYIGIALLYVMGFVIALWAEQCSGRPFTWLFFAMILGLFVSFTAGLLVFRLLELQAQFVSLSLLSLYLACMVFAATTDGYRSLSKRNRTKGDSIVATCQWLSTEYGLSPREKEILEYLARGRGSKYISGELYISVETVRTHTKRIYDKTGVHSKEELLDLIEIHS